MADPWLLAFLPMLPTLDACRRATAAGFELWSPSVTEPHRRPHGRGRVWITRPAYPSHTLISPGIDLAQLRRRFERWRIRPLQGDGGALSEAEVNEAQAARGGLARGSETPETAAGALRSRLERHCGGRLVLAATRPGGSRRWRATRAGQSRRAHGEARQHRRLTLGRTAGRLPRGGRGAAAGGAALGLECHHGHPKAQDADGEAQEHKGLSPVDDAPARLSEPPSSRIPVWDGEASHSGPRLTEIPPSSKSILSRNAPPVRPTAQVAG